MNPSMEIFESDKYPWKYESDKYIMDPNRFMLPDNISGITGSDYNETINIKLKL